VEDAVNAEAVDTHCLNHHVPLRTRTSLEGVENDRLRLLVSNNLAHSSVFGVAPVALLHFLDDAELLPLRYTATNTVDSFGQVFEFHVLQHCLVKTN